MERADICSDCIHYHVCEDAYNYKSECMNFLDEKEVARVRHGKWIGDDPAEWECSLCHYKVARWNNTSYCPCCGAKMLED